MRFKHLACLAIITTLLGGCGILKFKDEPGSGFIKQKTTITEQLPTGTVKTTETSSEISVKQPDNGKTAAGITQRDGNITINTGNAHNTTQILANANLLTIPMYFGIAMIGLGVILGIFAANKTWAIIIGTTGVLMVVGTYLLAQYAIYFLLGLGIILLYVGYLLYDRLILKKSNEENIKAIEVALDTGQINKDAFAKIENTIQNKKTKSIVDEVQRKIGKKK